MLESCGAGMPASRLFGTLMVEETGADKDDDISVVARTATLRDGSFGHDGTTRANIGFINESGAPVDIQVTSFDGDTGAMLKAFRVSDIVHHSLRGESGRLHAAVNVLIDISDRKQIEAELLDAYQMNLDPKCEAYRRLAMAVLSAHVKALKDIDEFAGIAQLDVSAASLTLMVEVRTAAFGGSSTSVT